MKRAPLFLFVLAMLVAMAWPLSSAIGAASSRTGARPSLEPASCVPGDASAMAEDDDDDDDDDVALPPGHPSLGSRLPPGHPPLSADGLPPGHPPVGRGLPPGHPPIPSGHAPGAPLQIDAFGTPVLLTI